MSWFTSLRDTVESAVAVSAAPLTGNQAKGWTSTSAQKSTLGQLGGDVGKAEVIGSAVVAAPYAIAAGGAALSGASAAGGVGGTVAAVKAAKDLLPSPESPQGVPAPSPAIVAIPTANPTTKDYTPLAILASVGLIAYKVLA